MAVVQIEIEKKRSQFILTGSSARKLKRGSGNLLGGRAFNYSLFPFSYRELGNRFNLTQTLQFGSLPHILSLKSEGEIKDYLRGYIANYIREEIRFEQIVRNLDPFRDFLDVAAQSNGKIINFSKIAQDVGVSDKTITSYYQILSDTLIGFFLNPFHRSIRKRQRAAPKFYLFDLGVKRALENSLRLELQSKTYAFGEAFEHFMMLECFRLNDYLKLDYRFSYLRTKDDVEVDLIIERPGECDLLVEINSTNKVLSEDARSLNQIAKDWDKKVQAEIWSLDEMEKKEGLVHCRHWRSALDLHFR